MGKGAGGSSHGVIEILDSSDEEGEQVPARAAPAPQHALPHPAGNGVVRENGGTPLSPEQQERAERNRAEALKRKAEREAAAAGSSAGRGACEGAPRGEGGAGLAGGARAAAPRATSAFRGDPPSLAAPATHGAEPALSELAVARGRLEDAEQEKTRLRLKLEEQEKAMQQTAQELAAGTAELAAARSAIQRERADRDQAQQESTRLAHKLEKQTEETQRKGREGAAAQKDLEATKNRLQLAQSELEDAEQEKTRLRLKLEEQEKAMQQTAQELAAGAAEIAAGAAELAAARSAIQRERADRDQAQQESTRLAHKLEKQTEETQRKGREAAAAQKDLEATKNRLQLAQSELDEAKKECSRAWEEHEKAAVELQQEKAKAEKRDDAEKKLKKEVFDLLKEKEDGEAKRREDEKKGEEAALRRENVIKKLTKDLKDKDKEIDRLRAAEQDKGLQIKKMHAKQEAKEKELKEEARKKRETESKAKDQQIATLDLKLKQAEAKLAIMSEEARRKPDASRHEASLHTTVAAAAEPKEVRKAPGGCPRTPPSRLVFGTVYQFGRGSPQKAQRRVDCPEPPCDDAFGCTSSCLVLCDGVGGGGAASGRWARICVKACLTEAAKVGVLLGAEQLPRLGDVTRNAAGEIVAGAMKRLQNVAGFEDDTSHATSTLLALQLIACKDSKGETVLKIDACEIGDSRWALLCWDAVRKGYVCAYLAEVHMHEIDHGSLAPYQVAPPGQVFGKGADFYFSEYQYKKVVLRSHKLHASSAFEVADHRPIVVAGSDGLWDNFVGNGPLGVAQTSQAIREKLELTVNDFFQNTGMVDITALGGFLKMSTVNAMAAAGGKSDDLSIFVSSLRLETQPVKDGVLIPEMFDGSLSNADIQRGVERVTGSCPAPKSVGVGNRASVGRPPLSEIPTRDGPKDPRLGPPAGVKRSAPSDPRRSAPVDPRLGQDAKQRRLD